MASAVKASQADAALTMSPASKPGHGSGPTQSHSGHPFSRRKRSSSLPFGLFSASTKPCRSWPSPPRSDTVHQDSSTRRQPLSSTAPSSSSSPAVPCCTPSLNCDSPLSAPDGVRVASRTALDAVAKAHLGEASRGSIVVANAGKQLAAPPVDQLLVVLQLRVRHANRRTDRHQVALAPPCAAIRQVTTRSSRRAGCTDRWPPHQPHVVEDEVADLRTRRTKALVHGIISACDPGIPLPGRARPREIIQQLLETRVRGSGTPASPAEYSLSSYPRPAQHPPPHRESTDSQ